MKKTGFIFALIAIVLSFKSQAQCGNYKVSSNLGCAVTFDFAIYDGVACTNICYSQTGNVVGPNSLFNIPCGSCATSCNVEITFTDIGGNTVNVLVDTSTTTTTQIGNFGSPCSSGLEYVEYDPSTQSFKVHQ